MKDDGSVLVETIGMLVLIALLVVGLFTVSLVLLKENSLSHAAALAARSGAIGGSSAARAKVHSLLGASVEEKSGQVERAGISYFEVELSQTVLTIFGPRRLLARAHAIAEP